MNMLDYKFVKRQEKEEAPNMFSRKNSWLGIYRKSIDVLLGIGLGIVGERSYYCLSSTENRYAVPGILTLNKHS